MPNTSSSETENFIKWIENIINDPANSDSGPFNFWQPVSPTKKPGRPPKQLKIPDFTKEIVGILFKLVSQRNQFAPPQNPDENESERNAREAIEASRIVNMFTHPATHAAGYDIHTFLAHIGGWVAYKAKIENPLVFEKHTHPRQARADVDEFNPSNSTAVWFAGLWHLVIMYSRFDLKRHCNNKQYSYALELVKWLYYSGMRDIRSYSALNKSDSGNRAGARSYGAKSKQEMLGFVNGKEYSKIQDSLPPSCRVRLGYLKSDAISQRDATSPGNIEANVLSHWAAWILGRYDYFIDNWPICRTSGIANQTLFVATPALPKQGYLKDSIVLNLSYQVEKIQNDIAASQYHEDGTKGFIYRTKIADHSFIEAIAYKTILGTHAGLFDFTYKHWFQCISPPRHQPLARGAKELHKS